MDPFTISMAVAPLVLSSAKLTMLASAVRDSYINAPTTLTATLTECKIIHITLSKIQGLVYKNETDLSSRLAAQAPLREAFDGALTGCRMTLAALNLELEKLAEAKKPISPLEIGFKAKTRLVWKEDIMKQLLDQTRGQMLSLRCLIELLESETQADMFRLLKQNTADIQKILHRAKSIRSYQGFDDDQSSFNFINQSDTYGLVPSYETQLAQSSTYQRAQTAAAQELLASKIELLDEKYALEERIDGLLLDGDTKDKKVAQLGNDALLKDKKVAGLENDALLKDQEVARLKSDILLKDEEIAHLKQDKSSTDDIISRQDYALSIRDDRLLSLEGKRRELQFEERLTQNMKLNTLLQLAVVDGHVKVVEALLNMGVNMEVADEDGYTPLYSAAGRGNVEVVKILIERGANVEATDWNNWSPLHWAANNGHDEVVRILLQSGANAEATSSDGQTPLHSAAKWGHVGQVKMLIEKGANIEAEHRNGETPLHLSAKEGHVDIVKLLLEKGAKKHAIDGVGSTPLSLATSQGHAEVIKLLLDHYFLSGSDGERFKKKKTGRKHAISI